MTLDECIETLQNYNDWRRGSDTDQPDPKKIGIAIDTAIENLKKLQENT